MTRFPGTIAGAAVLAGAPRAPQADAKALHAEYAEYAEAVERWARAAAGVEPKPARGPDGENALISAMFRAEDRIMEAPGGDLAMLALRLMATFCSYQRVEDDNTCTLDPLRQMRDEAAELAGLPIVDEFAAVARHGRAA